jgi:hypothetical protein
LHVGRIRARTRHALRNALAGFATFRFDVESLVLRLSLEKPPWPANLRVDAPIIQIAWLAIGTGLLLWGRHPQFSGDDIVRWAALRELLLQGRLGDGSPYSYISSLFAVPLYLIGRLFDNTEGVVPYFNLLEFVLIGPIILVLLARRIDWPLARLTALLLLSASMFPLHLGYFYAEVFTALLVTLGFLLVSARPLLASVLYGLGVANTPALFPGLMLASAWMAWRWRRVWLMALPLPGLSLYVGENILRYGSLFHNPYFIHGGFRTIMPYSGRVGFSYPMIFGILNVLLSIDKGPLLFVPGIFAALNRALFDGPLRPIRIEVEAMLIFLAGMVLTYAKWWSWYGGFAWGPRFFLFAFVPCSLLLAAGLGQVRTFKCGALLSAAIMIQTWGTIQSLLYGMRDMGPCTDNNYAHELLCWYAPEFNPLFRQFVVGFKVVPQKSLLPFAIWCGLTCLVLCGSSLWRVVRIRINETGGFGHLRHGIG